MWIAIDGRTTRRLIFIVNISVTPLSCFDTNCIYATKKIINSETRKSVSGFNTAFLDKNVIKETKLKLKKLLENWHVFLSKLIEITQSDTKNKFDNILLF